MRTLGVENAQKIFKVGDLVTIDPDGYPANAIRGVYRVKRTPTGRGYNYTCESLLGGRGVKAAPYSMTRWEGTEEEARTWVSPSLQLVDPDEFQLPPVVGTVVTLVHVRGVVEGTPFVVLGDSRKGGVKVARLGGEDGRYWPHIGMKHIRTLSPMEIVDAVIEHG